MRQRGPGPTWRHRSRRNRQSGRRRALLVANDRSARMRGSNADKLMGAGVATNPHCPGSDPPGPRGARLFFAGAEFPPRHCCRFGFPVPVPAEALLPRSVPVRVLSFDLAAFRIVPFQASHQSGTLMGSLSGSRRSELRRVPSAAIEASLDRHPFEITLKAEAFNGHPFAVACIRLAASHSPLRRSLGRWTAFPESGFGLGFRRCLALLPWGLALPSSVRCAVDPFGYPPPLQERQCPGAFFRFWLSPSRSAAPGHICKLTGRPESRQHNQPVDK
jgi:hypothetical protein